MLTQSLQFELYLRVRGDRNSHHQDMIPFSEKPPQASVVSPHIQVPNMQALDRTSRIIKEKYQ